MESFIDQKCNELALGSLKRDAEIKQQISQELEAHYNTSLVKSLKGQIDILKSEVYFLWEELREKNNLFKILILKDRSFVPTWSKYASGLKYLWVGFI